MSDSWPALFKRADVTRSYHFKTDDDNVIEYPKTPEAILAIRGKYEREIVEARGEVDLALRHYNELIDGYNEAGTKAAAVLKETYGMLAHPALKPKLDLAGEEAHGTVPPAVPKAYEENT